MDFVFIVPKTPVSKEQPLADRIITTFMMLLFPAWVAFIPVDVFYLKILPGPHIAISICGAVIFLFGYVLIMVTIYQNSFAIPVVEDQSKYNQVLVETGVYAYVRNPMYLGFLLSFAGLTLWLESYAGLN